MSSSSSLTGSELAHWSDSKQGEIIGTVVVALLLGNLAVPLRVWGQWRAYKRLFWEDYTLFAGLVLTNFTICCYAAAVPHGLGLHEYRLKVENPAGLVYVYKYRLWVAAANIPAVYFIKTTLLLFYRRIFLINQTWSKTLWYIIFVYNTLWVLGATPFLAVQCWPVAFFWNRLYSQLNLPTSHHYSGRCFPATTVTATIPLILGLVSDFATLLLPTLLISRLHRSWRKKIALLALFGFGLLACVLELARVVVFLVRTNDREDSSYGVCDVAILTYCAEVLGILCASLPMIASLIRSYRGHKPSTHQAGDSVALQYRSDREKQLLDNEYSRTRRTDDASLSFSESAGSESGEPLPGAKYREMLNVSPHQPKATRGR